MTNELKFITLSIVIAISLSSMMISYAITKTAIIDSRKGFDEKIFNIALCVLEKKPVPEEKQLRDWALNTVDIYSSSELPKKYINKYKFPSYGQCIKNNITTQ